MNYDDLIKSVAQDTGLNPTPWDQEGASELKINFKPDGSYTKQIQGTWKPVAQLAQQMAKGREPSPSMKGMSPEMILQFADRQGAAGEQRKRDLGLFAGIVDKMQGQKAAARQQDFEEHKYNNPDLVKLPGVPVPVKRDQVTQALRDQATQRLKEGRLSAEKYGLITEMLDAKDMMRTRGAQRAASYASAKASNAQAEAQRRGLDQFIDVPFGDLGSASVKGSDLLEFWNPEDKSLAYSGGAGSGVNEKDFLPKISKPSDLEREWQRMMFTGEGEDKTPIKMADPQAIRNYNAEAEKWAEDIPNIPVAIQVEIPTVDTSWKPFNQEPPRRIPVRIPYSIRERAKQKDPEAMAFVNNAIKQTLMDVYGYSEENAIGALR